LKRDSIPLNNGHMDIHVLETIITMRWKVVTKLE
jgi:hypothetical protein